MRITEIYFKLNHVGIHWQSDEFGWGVINFNIKPNGSIELETETMGKEFAKEVLNALVDTCKLIE